MTREETNAYHRAYYAANKERCQARSRAYYARNAQAHAKRIARRLAQLTPAEKWLKYFRNHLSRYTLSLDRFQYHWDLQGGKCQICAVQFPDPFKPAPKTKRAHIDHDHLTGEVRGLLCAQCNILLGAAKDRVDLLQKAIAYIAMSREE